MRASSAVGLADDYATTCGCSRDIVQSPSLRACVTQLSTTPCRAAKTSSGSASPQASQPRRGRSTSQAATARAIRCSEKPRLLTSTTRATPPIALTHDATVPMRQSWRGPGRARLEMSHLWTTRRSEARTPTCGCRFSSRFGAGSGFGETSYGDPVSPKPDLLPEPVSVPPDAAPAPQPP